MALTDVKARNAKPSDKQVKLQNMDLWRVTSVAVPLILMMTHKHQDCLRRLWHGSI